MGGRPDPCDRAAGDEDDARGAAVGIEHDDDEPQMVREKPQSIKESVISELDSSIELTSD
jgi:hypothetical protein